MDPSANRATDPPANRAPDAVRDLRGGVRLAMDGVRKAIDSAESLQQRMAAVQPPAQGLARGTGTGMGRSMSRMVLRGARGATDLMGSGLDTMLAAVQAALQRPQRERAPTGPQPMRDAAVAALNALVGDHLHRTENPLAIATHLRTDVRHEASGPGPQQLLVLLHDLGMGDGQWLQDGHDHGVALAAVLGCTAVHALYNSGRPVADVAREVAAQMELLVTGRADGPPRLSLIGHGLGGLVLHSALQQALGRAMTWPGQVRTVIFLGTPHDGAVLPRGWLDFSAGVAGALAPLTRLSGRTSAGMADFMAGHAPLVTAAPQHTSAHPATGGMPAPLFPVIPPGVRMHAIAGAIGDGSSDGLVPVTSALGQSARPDLQIPQEHRWVAQGVDHRGLLGSQAVFQQMRQWLAD